jgi:Protein-tyrosine phosphatase
MESSCGIQFPPISPIVDSLLRGGDGNYFLRKDEKSILLASSSGGTKKMTRKKSYQKKNNNNNDDNNNKDNDDDENYVPKALPLLQLCSVWKVGLTTCILTLYILNQKHLLPLPLSSWVSRMTFWPTLPWTWIRLGLLNPGGWMTKVDDVVWLGGIPFPAGGAKRLHQKGIRGVINLCDEYPDSSFLSRIFVSSSEEYQKLGIEYLYLPTPDHFEPSVETLWTAIEFIRRHRIRQQQSNPPYKPIVYVHCRAGHGRSAAIVLAWMAYQYWEQQYHDSHDLSLLVTRNMTNSTNWNVTNNITEMTIIQDSQDVVLQRLNMELCKKRKVRTKLWSQPHVKEFYQQLIYKAQHYQL